MSTQSASEVLRARLAGLAARGRRAARTEVTTFGALELDPELRTVEVNGVPLTLTRIEFDLLHALITHQRRVVPRWELLATGWESPPTGHVLDVHMSRLRRKVLDAGGPKVGEPVPGVGYRAGSPDRPPCGDHPAESDVATRVS
jgi:DNA-binding response OmpR family regulator